MNRRKFIQKSAMVGAAATMIKPWQKVMGANDVIRVAVVGFRGRGQSHIDGFSNLKGVEVTALCDVDSEVLAQGAAEFEKKGIKVKTTQNYRDLLADKDIDVISIATPNHTHAIITIEACQAGKDVYVEKPVSHNVFEGRKMVEAAAKYQRIVQTGTQSRSNPGMQEAVKFLHDGELGAIRLARGLCYKRRKSIGKVDQATDLPRSVDYNLWSGPAPVVPLMRSNLHYDWHWDFLTGNGDLGNQGIHQMDIARWILNERELSPEVFSIGGRFGYVDDGNTPNTQIVYHNFKKAPLIFEVRGLARWIDSNDRPAYLGASIGVIAECENGYMVIPTYDSGTAYDNSGKVIRKFKGSGDHFANFIDAVRSRKPSDLNADILEGHLSSALCHTGNISYLTGHNKAPGQVLDSIQSNPVAVEAIGRMFEHLQVNDIDLNTTQITMGEYLNMDPATEKFTNSPEANQLLKREYRKPFVISDDV